MSRGSVPSANQVNTFASHVSLIFALPSLFLDADADDAAAGDDDDDDGVVSALLVWQAAVVVQGALTAVFVYGERHHLMVWRVFAPKFIFDGALLVVVDALTLGAVGLFAARSRIEPTKRV